MYFKERGWKHTQLITHGKFNFAFIAFRISYYKSF